MRCDSFTLRLLCSGCVLTAISSSTHRKTWCCDELWTIQNMQAFVNESPFKISVCHWLQSVVFRNIHHDHHMVLQTYCRASYSLLIIYYHIYLNTSNHIKLYNKQTDQLLRMMSDTSDIPLFGPYIMMYLVTSTPRTRQSEWITMKQHHVTERSHWLSETQKCVWICRVQCLKVMLCECSWSHAINYTCLPWFLRMLIYLLHTPDDCKCCYHLLVMCAYLHCVLATVSLIYQTCLETHPALLRLNILVFCFPSQDLDGAPNSS